MDCEKCRKTREEMKQYWRERNLKRLLKTSIKGIKQILGKEDETEKP